MDITPDKHGIQELYTVLDKRKVCMKKLVNDT